jgi:hypothetical protein
MKCLFFGSVWHHQHHEQHLSKHQHRLSKEAFMVASDPMHDWKVCLWAQFASLAPRVLRRRLMQPLPIGSGPHRHCASRSMLCNRCCARAVNSHCHGLVKLPRIRRATQSMSSTRKLNSALNSHTRAHTRSRAGQCHRRGRRCRVYLTSAAVSIGLFFVRKRRRSRRRTTCLQPAREACNLPRHTTATYLNLHSQLPGGTT